MGVVSQFDRLLAADGPAALVIRQHLMPVEGRDGVFFPATYAAGDGFAGGYNIDQDASGRTVALIDSVGSQANRIEPIFKEEGLRHLVPQIAVTAGEKEVSILEVGHRAGDALMRCSALQHELQSAFHAVLKGDCEPLAKIAPTSLVFGVWDSRDTQAKLPRLVSSTIRAYGVRRLTRSAVYTAPVDYSALNVFSEEDKQKAEGDSKNPLSKRGFVNALASATHGGVIADGDIVRDATLGLAALRQLKAGGATDRTQALQRYVLGLALVAFTSPPAGYLRQGCLLVLNPQKSSENEFVEVFPNGERKHCEISMDAALNYAAESAKAFGVGKSRTVSFDPDRATKDVKGEGNVRETAKSRAKKAAAKADNQEG